MKTHFTKFALAVLLAFTITACGEKPQPVPAQAPTVQQQVAPASAAPGNTTVVQAPAQAPVVVQNEQSSWMPAALGAAAGYMLGRSTANSNNNNAGNYSGYNNNTYHSSSRVVEREVIREVPSSTSTAQQNKPAFSAKPPEVNTGKSAVNSAPATPKFSPAPVPSAAPAPRPSFAPSGYSSVRQSSPSFSSRPSGRR